MVFCLRQQFLSFGFIFAGDDAPSQIAWMASVFIVYIAFVGIAYPWNVPEFNILDVFGCLFVVTVLLLVSGFSAETIKGTAFEKTTFALLLVMLILFGGVLMRSGICALYYGRNETYRPMQKPKLTDQECKAVLTQLFSLSLDADVVSTIAANLLPRDRAALVEFCGALECATLREVNFFSRPAGVVFLTTSHMALAEHRTSFGNQLKSNISNSKLESYI